MQAQLWTVSGLAVELDRDRRSLSRELENLEPDEVEKQGNRTVRRYRMARVVAHLMGQRGEALDLNAERARLAKEQADKIERENALARGELVVIGAVEKWAEGLFHEVKAKFLGMPRALAPLLAAYTDPRQVEEKLEDAIHESLRALSAGDASAVIGAGAEGADAATEADGEPVGGPPSEAEPGEQRGAGALVD